MFSKKYKISSDELGASLFNDFVLPSCKNIYDSIIKEKDKIAELELFIAYAWLVNHFLNISGPKYEKTASSLNHNFFNYYQKHTSKSEALDGDSFFNLLNFKFNLYKKDFMSGEKNMNFEKVSIAIYNNVLPLDKPHINISVNFTIGIRLQQSALALGELLKETKLSD